MSTRSAACAAAVGLAAYTTLGGGPALGDIAIFTVVGTAVPAAVTFLICQGMLRRLLGRRIARIAARARE